MLRSVGTSRRNYDHRIRDAVARARDPSLFPELEIPAPTARSWIRRGTTRPVGFVDESHELKRLTARVQQLEHRVAVLTCILRLVLTLLRVTGRRLHFTRVPEGIDKTALVAAVEKARRVLPLQSALRVIGLSPSRYHSWVAGSKTCVLDDRPSCPRKRPQRLTALE